ncbi:MAG: EthD family reductase [Subtercola sp.]|nr:EthD family reductase [Subtercola sp.]
MIKLLVFNKRKEGVSREEFREYYETIHAPLAKGYFPMVLKYRRNYLNYEQSLLTGRNAEEYVPLADFDSIAEVFFEDWAAFEAFREKSALPDLRAQIKSDEENFLDVSAIRRYIVEVDGDSPSDLTDEVGRDGYAAVESGSVQ